MKSKRTVSVWRICLSVVFLVCVLEVLLRLVGFVVLIAQRHSAGSTDGMITVLAIGESTTALSEWPVLLQENLSRTYPGTSWRVINEGVPGTTTSHIVARLPGLLQTYKPDYVVTMIGTNDKNALLLPLDANGTAITWLSDLRIVKVIRLLVATFYPQPDQRRLWGKLPETDTEVMKQYHAAMAALETGDYGTAEKELQQVLLRESSITNAALLALGRTYTALSRLPEAAHVYEQVGTREGWPDSDVVQLVSVYRTMGMSDQEVNNKLKSLKPDIDVSVSSTTSADKITEGNYRRIHEEIVRSGAVHVVMQYPTLSLNPLELLFDTGKDVVYAENESNFSQALQDHVYTDLFTDTFGVTWGHTTRMGDSLIASAAARAIGTAFVSHTP